MPRSGGSRKKAAASAGLTYDDVREIAHDFPGLEESTSYGTPALKVRGQLLTRLREDNETLVVKTTFVEREFLMQADPQVYFLEDHYRNYPYVLMRLGRVRKKEIRERLEDGWRRLASKQMLARFEQGDRETAAEPASRPRRPRRN
jgi:hypothetical protein